ncbi:MAG: anti-sigma factor domain-containing protein [Anaerolineae bacterium]
MKTQRRVLLGLFVLLFLWPLAASANGHSLTLYLSYVPNLSNWGPVDARGEAKVNVGEGTIELHANGLPALSEQVYEVWLVTAGLDTWISMGRFNAAADGSVAYAAAVDNVPVQDYRYLVISIEPTTDDPREPSGQNAIAAIFPNPDVAIVAKPAEGTATVAGTDTTIPPPPAYLPETGAAVVVERPGVLLFLLIGVLAMGIVWRRR